MTAQALLARLSRLGITVELDGGDRLSIEGPDDRVEAEIETIREHKPAIIAHLKSQLGEQASNIRSSPSVAPAAADRPPMIAAREPDPSPTRPEKSPKPAPTPRVRPPGWRPPSERLRDQVRKLTGGAATLVTSAGSGAKAAAGLLAGFSPSRFTAMFTPARETPAVISGALGFQNDLTEIIEEPAPKYMRLTGYLLACFIGLALLISAVVQIDVVIRGTGKLTVDGPPLVLQPLERSILRALHVKPGDVVTQGQVLATLDPTFAEADVTAIESQQRILMAQMRRLEAEARDEPIRFDGNTVEEKLQGEIYRQRRQEYLSRLRAFDEDIKRAQAGLRTLEVERGLLEQQLVVARDVEQMRATLLASQSGSRLQYLEARSVRIRSERDHQGANDRLVELTHELDSKRADRQAFMDEWRRRLFEEIERLRGDVARIEGAQAKAKRFKELVVISAPQDGVVIDVAKRSVGSVLKEAETLIMLAPSHMPLIAEVQLASADVGYAKAGDDVIVKVDTFPFTRHGSLKGRLRAISQESFTPGQDGSGGGQAGGGGSFHRGQVVLTSTELERMPDGARLIPGMTVGADIKVGSRTVISYFLDPLMRGFDESIREP